MNKEKCKFCEMEFITKRGYVWYPNGTWGKKGGLFLVFIGKEELLNIFKEIERQLGRPIDKLITLAKRIVTINVVDEEFLGRFMRFLVRLRLVNGNMLKNTLNKKLTSSIGWGVCDEAKLNYKEKKASFKFRNYPSIALIEGAIGGIVQYMFRLESVKITSQKKDGILETKIEPKDKESELAKYIQNPAPASKLEFLPGNINYNLCPNCKVPKEFSDRYKWDMSGGKIIHKNTKKDYLLFTRYAIEAIFNLLIKELGDDIKDIILNAEKKYIKENLIFSSNNNTEDYRETLNVKEFGLKGWGNFVAVKKENNNLVVHVDNPFNEIIIGGLILGCYEAIENKEGNIKWKKEKENSVIFKVLPK